jgi:hypothetical protein
MRIVVAALCIALVACSSEGTERRPSTAATAPATTPTTPAEQPRATDPASTRSARATTSLPPVTASIADPLPTSTEAAPNPVIPTGFERVAATVTTADGTVCELCLWLAETSEQRQRGLMFVTDLAGADGMLFRYDAPTSGAFWMKNTVMPLSIAFFDASGRFVDAFDMQPCTGDPCPSFQTPSFLQAIEVPQGGLDALGIQPDSVLTVSAAPCGRG